MSEFDSFFVRPRGVASVEQFLLLRQERQLMADARGYMGDCWDLPFTGESNDLALASSCEQSGVDEETEAAANNQE